MVSSLKVMDSSGIGFSPGKASWKIGKLDKNPGNVLEFSWKSPCLAFFILAYKIKTFSSNLSNFSRQINKNPF